MNGIRLSTIGKRYCGCCLFEIPPLGGEIGQRTSSNPLNQQVFKHERYGQVCLECKQHIDYVESDPPVPYYLYCRDCNIPLTDNEKFNKHGRCNECIENSK